MKDIWFETGSWPCVVSVSDDYGEAVVNGRTWRWEWHNYLGPEFVNKDGSSRKRIPGIKHPVWKALKKWERKRRAKEAKP